MPPQPPHPLRVPSPARSAPATKQEVALAFALVNQSYATAMCTRWTPEQIATAALWCAADVLQRPESVLAVACSVAPPPASPWWSRCGIADAQQLARECAKEGGVLVSWLLEDGVGNLCVCVCVMVCV